jgi:hypothetical protein
VSIHPGRDPASPEQILRVFMEAGGDAGKVAMCHLDRKHVHVTVVDNLTKTKIFKLFNSRQAPFSVIKICLILPLSAPIWNLTCLETSVRTINLIDLLICLLMLNALVIFTN